MMLILPNYHSKLLELQWYIYTFYQKSTGNSNSKSPLRDCQNPFRSWAGTIDVEFECDLSFSLFTVLDVVSLSQVCFVIFPMDKNIEQRIFLKFCIANGISYAEWQKMLPKTYGESALSKTRAYVWYSAFKSGRDYL